ncbi:calmodulin-related protein touch-induced [Chrysochromulina tobinii]|uniref:Calmodulin-related protein touch-induced n=1 Tax=Chrysochromulina tobinii TaxID=1460289 RepID=A0A0M0JVB1_9EUKA|nr:calmodulin-related protein touch-induced [Chrysochromulina tobinii]|eukprot:KOO30454.1 calmodulin-related protein touch-induced [Chrysochromulina sp. CCMP291]
MAARDTGTVLQLTKAGEPLMKPANVASALHRLAVLNKRERASRDALLRDPRFERLVVMLAGRAEALSSRSVSDVLWSFATLQHWPPMLLKPLLTSVATHLTKDDIEAPYLSTMVWALAKLECKPVRLLERMEEIALPLLSQMNTQNLANLFWGFAKLNYQPTRILPKIEEALLAPGMLETAKPVEVADLAYALGLVGAPHAHDRLLLALANRAAPDPVFGCLHTFSSRQIVILIWVVARLDAVAQLPEGRMEAWRSEMLNTWTDLADGRSRRRAGRAYSDEELRIVFEAIDSDGSGDIDQAELLDAIRAIRPDATDEDVARMLAVADGDGNDTINLAEFKLMMSTPQPSSEPAA